MICWRSILLAAGADTDILQSKAGTATVSAVLEFNAPASSHPQAPWLQAGQNALNVLHSFFDCWRIAFWWMSLQFDALAAYFVIYPKIGVQAHAFSLDVYWWLIHHSTLKGRHVVGPVIIFFDWNLRRFVARAVCSLSFEFVLLRLAAALCEIMSIYFSGRYERR